MPNTGGFEVQNSRGHEAGKYLCLFVCRRKSSIVSNGFDAIPIPQGTAWDDILNVQKYV